MKLTKKQMETLIALRDLNHCSVYQLAHHLFGERYGIFATRAQGRFQTLKRMNLADNKGGFLYLTSAGRAALNQKGEE